MSEPDSNAEFEATLRLIAECPVHASPGWLDALGDKTSSVVRLLALPQFEPHGIFITDDDGQALGVLLNLAAYRQLIGSSDDQ